MAATDTAAHRPIDPRGPMARAYRNNRREGMLAIHAWNMAKASARGRELAADSEDTRDGGREWTIDAGSGIVVRVQQVPDQEACDCWHDANPGDRDSIPSHGHFGIVATASYLGREVIYDACWGFVWDWPGQDDDAELARAWDDVAAGAIDHARKMASELPAWVVAQVDAWGGGADG